MVSLSQSVDWDSWLIDLVSQQLGVRTTTLAERIKVFYELLSSEQPPRGLGSPEAAPVAAAAAI